MAESVKTARSESVLDISYLERRRTLARPMGCASTEVGKQQGERQEISFVLCVLTLTLFLEKALRRGTCRMPGLDGLAAARNFLFQPENAAFELMCGQGGNIF